MHPRERVLGVALYHRAKGEPVPLDVLAELEKYGLEIGEFVDLPRPIDEPSTTEENEGDFNNEAEKTDV